MIKTIILKLKNSQLENVIAINSENFKFTKNKIGENTIEIHYLIKSEPFKLNDITCIAYQNNNEVEIKMGQIIYASIDELDGESKIYQHIEMKLLDVFNLNEGIKNKTVIEEIK